MRRLLAIAIIFLLGLPAVSPLFALTGAADPSVPACCRRDGKHHCFGMAGMAAPTAASDSSKTHVIAAIVTERCPYGSYSLPGAAQPDYSLHLAAAIFAGIVAHPAIAPQVESRRRISADRSRQKRGPPAALPFA